jgi:hypothetical protein
MLVGGGLSVPLGGQPVAATRPLPGTDPTKVLFELQDGLGLLRGLEQSDSVARVEYWGTTGTMTVEGKAAKLSSFKVSLNYDVPGMRFDFTRDGKRQIQVVADTHAWDEETPGGPAAPMPAQAAERRLQLFLTPIGVAKAAALAGEALTVTLANGRTVVSFPFQGATITATLNELFQPETVSAQAAGVVHEWRYQQYGELNDNAKADVYLPRRLTHTVNGAPVLDLTVKNSNTYNPYVVMPVPPNVR